MRHLIAALILCFGAPSIAFAQDWVNLTVTSHVNSAFNQAAFDNDLAVANESLRYDDHDCADDVPCSVRFRRNGAVGTFGNSLDGLDMITTGAERDAVFGIGTHRVKIVTIIDICAGAVNPSIIGCGRCNGFGFIIESGQPASVAVHEYGHNVMGCSHRDSCSWNIMHTFSNGANNSVNAPECSGFGGTSYTQLCGDVFDGGGGPLTMQGGPYWVTCDVTVPAGRALTIEPGVEIQLDQGGRRISSYGTTYANGQGSRILIYSNNAAQNFPSATVDGPLVLESGGELILD